MAGTISVRLGDRGYPILIRPGALRDAGPLVRKVTRARRALLLSAPPVYARYGARLSQSLSRTFDQVSPCLIPDGETHKNEGTLFGVFRRMRSLGLHRDCCVVALGGGVVGDLAGLASSLYMRGTDLVQVPTTLLAQVDASIGGKTAIDFGGIKNLIGSFHQPRMVLVDPQVLGTLDERQMRTGLAEVIKYGVIRDADLFGRLERELPRFFRRDPAFLSLLIRRSAAIKADIISRDEREGGLRMWLNYGHTLGHALESYYGYRDLTHGEAVAYGMWAAAMISGQLGLCSAGTVERQRDLLRAAGLLRRVRGFSIQGVYRKLSLDKKVRAGKNQFILTRKIGLVTIQKNVPENPIFSALKRLRTEMTRTPS